MIINILMIIIGFVLLIKGADLLVDGASGIAKKFHIPEIIIGLTINARAFCKYNVSNQWL